MKNFLSWARSLSLPAALPILLLSCSTVGAQTNPCDLNLDGVVNYADVLDAVQMMNGQTACTANILGVNTCNLSVVYRVGLANRSGVCFTGQVSTPFLLSLSLSPNVVISGASAVGTVTLNGPAGSDGVLVSLNSTSSALQIPSSVAIAAGATSATFPIITDTVDANTPALLTAYYSGVWATAEFAVDSGSTLSLAGLSVTPGLLTSQQSATGTVELTGPAPSGGVVVALSSLNTAISFPTAVTVPEGATSADFPLTAGTVTTDITAQLSASYGGVTSTINLMIYPGAVTLNWIASTSPNVAGYNVYRGTASGGPYTLMNTGLVPGTSYVDSAVTATLTYYYVTTAVDTSNDESAYSNEADVTVP